MAIDYANALMEYIKSEKDEKRLKVIELGVRKMLERELMEIKERLEKYKTSEARFISGYNMDFTESEKRFEAGGFPEDSDSDYIEWYAVHDAYEYWKKNVTFLKESLVWISFLRAKLLK
jgi:hypothetical protein